MEVIIFEKEAYNKMIVELVSTIRKTIKETQEEYIKQHHTAEWITLKEAQKLLPYKSKATWQKFRDTGKIVFTQNGRSILYSRKSILELLNKNAIRF